MTTTVKQVERQKKREQRKKSVRIVLMLGLALSCACLWLLFCVGSSITVTMESSLQESVVERGQWELTEGTEVTQEFLAKYSYLESVRVLVANLDENNRECSLVVSLLDENGKELCRQEVPVRYIKPGNYYEIPIHQTLHKNKVYTLSFHAEHQGEYIPRLLYVNQDEDVWEQTDLYVMGELQQGGLVLGYIYQDQNMKGFLDPSSSGAAFFRVKTAGVLVFVVFLLGLLYIWMDRFREAVKKTCRISARVAGQAAFLLLWPVLFLTAAFLGKGISGAQIWNVWICAAFLAVCLLGVWIFFHRWCRLRGEKWTEGLRNLVRAGLTGLRRQKWFCGALLLTVLFRLLQFTKTVRFDAGEIYAALNRGCAGFAYTWASFWEGIHLAGPWSVGSGFFLSIGEFLDPGGVTGVLSVKLILTAAAFYCLYQLLHRFSLRLSEKQAAFTALLIFSVPLFLGTFAYLSLDDLVICFFLFLLYAQCRERYLEMAFWAVMLALSQETGAVLAAAYLLCRVLLFFGKQKGGLRQRLEAACLDRGNWAAVLAGLACLFHLYLTGSFAGWMENAKGFGWNASYAGTVIKQIFFLNFNWLVLILLAVSLLLILIRKGKEGVEKRPPSILLWNVAGALFCLLLYQLVFRSNGYALDQLVLVTGFFALTAAVYWYAVRKREKTRWNGVLGSAFLCLFLAQAFLDLDPVSGLLFEKRDMGGRFDKIVSGYDSIYYGDGYVNNHQYAWMDRLLDQMLQEIGYDRNTTVILAGRQEEGAQISGRAGSFTLSWNPEKGKREYATSSGEGQTVIKIRSIDRLIGKLPWEIDQAARKVELESMKRRGVVFFFPGYEEDEEEQIEGLKRFYYVGDRKTLQSVYGSLSYYELCKKETYEGFSLAMFLPEAEPLPELEALLPLESYEYRYAQIGSFLEEREDIREGDVLQVELHGYLEGEELPEALMKSGVYEFSVGDGVLLAGLEEAAVGHTAGDTFTFAYEVPEGEAGLERLAGKTVEFKGTVLENEGRRYTEDLGMEEREEMLQEYKAQQRAYDMERQIRSAMDQMSEETFSEEEVAKEQGKFEKSFQNYLVLNGLTEETYREKYLRCGEKEWEDAKAALARAVLTVRRQRAAGGE